VRNRSVDAMSTKRERDGLLFCVLSAAGYGSMAVLAKLAYRAGVGVNELLLVRFALAAVILGALAPRGRRLGPVPRQAVLGALAAGAVLYALEAGLFFAALTRMKASVAELLLYAYPGIVLAGAVLLGRERATSRRVLALVLASGGVILVLAGGAPGSIDPLGAALALGAAVTYAVFVLAADTLSHALDPRALSALVCAGAAGAFALAGMVGGPLAFSFGAAGWAWIIALTLVSTVVAMTAFLGGIQRIGPSRASIVSTLEPPVTVALAFLVFGDRLGPLQLGGGALVLAGVVVMQVRIASRKRVAAHLTTGQAPARQELTHTPRWHRVGLRAQVGRVPVPGLRRRG
jgi:drug/metabolite transporter (DMT)-like permease